MRLIHNGFVAAAVVAFSVTAAAQNAPPPPTQTPPPDEPVTNPSMNPDQSTTAPGQMQTPPGQAQTPPGQAQTPPGQASQTTAQTSAMQATPATAADLAAGASIYDQNGDLVGTVKSVKGKNAVVDIGTMRAKIPISSIAKGDKGLMISMTKADLEAAAKKPPKP